MQGYAFLALAMILVGSTVTVSKVIGASLPPFTATAMRFAIAFPLFCLIMRRTGARWPRLGRGDWLVLLLQAAAGSVGYSALMIMGLKLTSAGNASVIIGTLPIVAAGIAALVLGERPGRGMLVMVLLAATGTGIIAFRSEGSGAGSLLGDLLVFGAVACEAVFILLNKRLKTEVEPLALSTLMTGLGLLLTLVPAAWEMRGIASMPAEAIWAVVYYAIIPTVGGYLLWYAGAARVSGTEASLFAALAPVSGLVLSVAFLGERAGWQQIVGAACVLAAIVLPLCRPAAPGGQQQQSVQGRCSQSS
jgi:drug/metabolite transporter (DMT)-like permease